MPSANRAETAILAQRKDISKQILAKEKYKSIKMDPTPPKKIQGWKNINLETMLAIEIQVLEIIIHPNNINQENILSQKKM